MKILFLTTHLNAGGITSYLYTLSKGLTALGHDVFVVSSGGDREKDFIALGVRSQLMMIRTKSELSLKLQAARAPLARYIRENGIEIIHAQTRVTQVLGWLVGRTIRRPYVSTCHGFFKPRLSRKLFPCWGQGVIAISAPVCEHLKNDLRVPPSIIHMIPSGIDTTPYTLVSEKERRERQTHYGWGKGPIIGIVARLSDVKGQDILVEAMRPVSQSFPQAKLVLAGQGKTETLLRQIVHDRGLDQQVIFQTETEDIVNLMSGFDVFVMPSRQEGLGLSIMEAQALGLPVVASRVGGIPQIIEDGVTGYLVPPEDPAALAEEIIHVLENKERARAVGQQAREFVLKEGSADKMVDKTLMFYKNIVEKR